MEMRTDRNQPWFASSLLIAIAVSIANLSAVAQSPADIYKTKCELCHGLSGSGDTPVGKELNARDFHSPDVQTKSDDELVKVLKQGFKSNGKTVMQGYADKLTEAQIRGLVTYVREMGKK
ncbi:MAG TPA: cytochrome c [Terriglobales bacterium]|jgi:mono/diheme cytochrome c family protein